MFMFKEFAENTVSKAKEDIVITQGMLALIAVVSFITGLIIGILCASSGKKSDCCGKRRRSSFNADEYARELNFDDDDDDYDGYEYSF